MCSGLDEMLVAFLYLSFLVTEGAYPATHWVVNSEGKIQAQASSVTNKYSYDSPRKPTNSLSYIRSYAQLRAYLVLLYFECNGVYNFYCMR